MSRKYWGKIAFWGLCVLPMGWLIAETTLCVYLAGPDVFYPEAIAIGEAKKALLDKAGHRGFFPMDNAIADFRHDQKTAGEIARANEQMMDQCDVILVNMRPWHGPSMDVGTAFEVGYMSARATCNPNSILIIGYNALDQRNFAARVIEDYYQGDVTYTVDGGIMGNDGMTLENFGIAENLMIIQAIEKSGGAIFPSCEEAVNHINELWVQKGINPE